MSIVLALNSLFYRYFPLLLLALKQPQGKECRTLKCLVCLEGMDLRLNSKGISGLTNEAAGDY